MILTIASRILLISTQRSQRFTSDKAQDEASAAGVGPLPRYPKTTQKRIYTPPYLELVVDSTPLITREECTMKNAKGGAVPSKEMREVHDCD